MKEKFLYLLRCPATGRKLELKKEFEENGNIKEGILIEPVSGNKYPITNFIPRFAGSGCNDYSENFALEWTKHGTIQYDSVSGYPISEDRFHNETGWDKSLVGQLILEAGCGAGRFTEHALNTGATVISFDLSTGVDLSYKLNGARDNLLLLQADIYNLPFDKNLFDKIFCFGILQYTPNPRKALFSVITHLKSGGSIVADIYAKTFVHRFLSPKTFVRLFTSRMNPEKLYPLTKKYIDIVWPLAKLIRKIPKIGPSLNWGFLVADYSRILPGAQDRMLKEWAYLDTFNILSARFEFMETIKTFSQWYKEAGMIDINVHYGYNGIEGKARKP